MSDTVRILLARQPVRGVKFTAATAKRLVGQRIQVAPGDPRTAGKITETWVEADGREIHAHVAIGEAPEPVKAMLKVEPSQPSIEGWSEHGDT